MRKRAAVQRSRRISAQELLAAMDTAFFSRAVLKLKYVLLQELTRRHDQLPEVAGSDDAEVEHRQESS